MIVNLNRTTGLKPLYDLLKKLRKNFARAYKREQRYTTCYCTYACVSILFLKELLQMPIASAGSVSELGSALFDEQFPLCPGVVLL